MRNRSSEIILNFMIPTHALASVLSSRTCTPEILSRSLWPASAIWCKFLRTLGSSSPVCISARSASACCRSSARFLSLDISFHSVCIYWKERVAPYNNIIIKPVVNQPATPFFVSKMRGCASQIMCTIYTD